MMSGSSSSATVHVEKATSDLLMNPDWAMIMDICDYVNSYPGQAKDVLKAVKKRLQHKSPKVQFLALTLLETMVQNCGDFVHFQIVEKNILDDMVKIVKKRTDMNVRDQTLVLLDTWQEAFSGRGGKYPQYYYVYDELRRSGVQFPQRSSRAAPPIFTPPVVHPVTTHVQGYEMPSSSSRRLEEAMASERESLSVSTLESMQSVNELLNEMLQAMNPGDALAIKDEIVVDLIDCCRANQRKLTQMLTTTEDEELLGRGLELHETTQSLLAKHDAISSGTAMPSHQTTNFSPRTPERRNSTTPRESEVKQVKIPTSSFSPATSAATAISKGFIVEEEEEEDDDFALLARRHSKSQPLSQSRTETAESTSKALVLADPPAPVKTSREQDMIDVLSLALTTTSPYAEESHQSPPATGPSPPVFPNGQADPYANQVNSSNLEQGQVPMQSYVAPWAQPQQQQPSFPQQPPYLPQQQHFTQQQPFPQQQFMQPRQQQPFSQPQQPRHYPPNTYVYPPPPWASSSSSSSFQAARTETSYGSNLSSSPVTGASSTGQKPYIPPYRLFEDLNVLGNRDGGQKTPNGSSTSSSSTSLSGQSRVGGRWR